MAQQKQIEINCSACDYERQVTDESLAANVIRLHELNNPGHKCARLAYRSRSEEQQQKAFARFIRAGVKRYEKRKREGYFNALGGAR